MRWLAALCGIWLGSMVSAQADVVATGDLGVVIERSTGSVLIIDQSDMDMLARVEGMPLESLREGVPWDWESFGEYLGKLDGSLGVNAGFMAGHSAIRRVVMGERAVGSEANAEELG